MDVVQLRLHVGSEKDHTKPYLLAQVDLEILLKLARCKIV